MANYIIKPGNNLQGEIIIPGDKSISHRSIILGSIAEGTSEISGCLESLDCLATLQAFQAMGVTIEQLGDGHLKIHGVGLKGLQAPKKILNLGNSGTSIRLLAGLLAGQKFSTELTGDASLCKRPMARMVNPLRQMGARIDMHNGNYPPLTIHGGQLLHGIHYDMPIASAQVKSGLLLAGLYADSEIVITEKAITRDHTERLLMAFGCQLSCQANKIILQKPVRLKATQINIPADISSAAFFIVGASIATNSDIVLKNVGINPTRTGIITILQMMGADIQLMNKRMQNDEPVADIAVRSARLKGVNIPEEIVSLAIDEFPAIFIAAACADGVTTLQNAQELRIKESDRIQTMADGLNKIDINAQTTLDGIIITGGKIKGSEINSYGDHRVAMAFAMAGLVSQNEIIIRDCINVATSFPGFVQIACQAGLKIKETSSN